MSIPQSTITGATQTVEQIKIAFAEAGKLGLVNDLVNTAPAKFNSSLFNSDQRAATSTAHLEQIITSATPQPRLSPSVDSTTPTAQINTSGSGTEGDAATVADDNSSRASASLSHQSSSSSIPDNAKRPDSVNSSGAIFKPIATNESQPATGKLIRPQAISITPAEESSSDPIIEAAKPAVLGAHDNDDYASSAIPLAEIETADDEPPPNPAEFLSVLSFLATHDPDLSDDEESDKASAKATPTQVEATPPQRQKRTDLSDIYAEAINSNNSNNSNNATEEEAPLITRDEVDAIVVSTSTSSTKQSFSPTYFDDNGQLVTHSEPRKSVGQRIKHLFSSTFPVKTTSTRSETVPTQPPKESTRPSIIPTVHLPFRHSVDSVTLTEPDNGVDEVTIFNEFDQRSVSYSGSTTVNQKGEFIPKTGILTLYEPNHDITEAGDFIFSDEKSNSYHLKNGTRITEYEDGKKTIEHVKAGQTVKTDIIDAEIPQRSLYIERPDPLKDLESVFVLPKKPSAWQRVLQFFQRNTATPIAPITIATAPITTELTPKSAFKQKTEGNYTLTYLASGSVTLKRQLEQPSRKPITNLTTNTQAVDENNKPRFSNEIIYTTKEHTEIYSAERLKALGAVYGQLEINTADDGTEIQAGLFYLDKAGRPALSLGTITVQNSDGQIIKKLSGKFSPTGKTLYPYILERDITTEQEIIKKGTLFTDITHLIQPQEIKNACKKVAYTEQDNTGALKLAEGDEKKYDPASGNLLSEVSVGKIEGKQKQPISYSPAYYPAEAEEPRFESTRQLLSTSGHQPQNSLEVHAPNSARQSPASSPVPVRRPQAQPVEPEYATLDEIDADDESDYEQIIPYLNFSSDSDNDEIDPNYARLSTVRAQPESTKISQSQQTPSRFSRLPSYARKTISNKKPVIAVKKHNGQDDIYATAAPKSQRSQSSANSPQLPPRALIKVPEHSPAESIYSDPQDAINRIYDTPQKILGTLPAEQPTYDVVEVTPGQQEKLEQLVQQQRQVATTEPAYMTMQPQIRRHPLADSIFLMLNNVVATLDAHQSTDRQITATQNDEAEIVRLNTQLTQQRRSSPSANDDPDIIDSQAGATASDIATLMKSVAPTSHIKPDADFAKRSAVRAILEKDQGDNFFGKYGARSIAGYASNDNGEKDNEFIADVFLADKNKEEMKQLVTYALSTRDAVITALQAIKLFEALGLASLHTDI